MEVGWSSGVSTVECDSFQMHGTRKASAWVDGYKMNIEAEDVNLSARQVAKNNYYIANTIQQPHIGAFLF